MFKKWSFYVAWLLLTAVFLTACSAAATSENAMPDMTMNDVGHGNEHDDEQDHADEPNRIPNDGAVIRLTSPADGATFAAGEDVVVEIETENITVGENGNHWHVYVNGASWGMVMGRNTREIVRNLEPGTHHIEVYLSVESHEELEEGDEITITVE